MIHIDVVFSSKIIRKYFSTLLANSLNFTVKKSKFYSLLLLWIQLKWKLKLFTWKVLLWARWICKSNKCSTTFLGQCGHWTFIWAVFLCSSSNSDDKKLSLHCVWVHLYGSAKWVNFWCFVNCASVKKYSEHMLHLNEKSFNTLFWTNFMIIVIPNWFEFVWGWFGWRSSFCYRLWAFTAFGRLMEWLDMCP